MFWLGLLFWAHLNAQAAQYVAPSEIDLALHQIFQTTIGKSICQNILAADPAAIQFHMGASPSAAQEIAKGCVGSAPLAGVAPTAWVNPTTSADIRKLTVKIHSARKYQILPAAQAFPIESWTDPYTNTTVFLTTDSGLPHNRLVQLLAHETAVYFDSKSNPAHPDAQLIPQLKNLELDRSRGLNPLVAISDPIAAHALTLVRALQVEFAIVRELVESGQINAPADFDDPYLNHVISAACTHECLKELILGMRKEFLPISLPLVAFASQFRSLVMQELIRVSPFWNMQQWSSAQASLNTLPADYLRSQFHFSDNPAADMQNVFFARGDQRKQFDKVQEFMDDELWPLEWPMITETKVKSGGTLLEFMKVPLLSGYNVLLSSGPRSRIRPGGVD